MKTRKHLSNEQKATVLREWIESGLSIGELAARHHVTPNDLYRWRKQLLENASEIFSRKRSDFSTRKEQARIQELEAKLKQRNTLISELAQENLELKKAPMGRFERPMGRAGHSTKRDSSRERTSSKIRSEARPITRVAESVIQYVLPLAAGSHRPPVHSRGPEIPLAVGPILIHPSRDKIIFSVSSSSFSLSRNSWRSVPATSIRSSER